MKSYTHLTLTEREIIAERMNEGKSFRDIAKELGRSPSTISREVKRNYSKKKNRYKPWRATTLYILRRRACRRKRILDIDPKLKAYILDRLKRYWSPEMIAARARRDGYQISHSTIYHAIKNKVFGANAPRAYLRRRDVRKYTRNASKSGFKPEHTIYERPIECETKERFGDFEGDTVLGAPGKGCLVTFVDRKSKLLVACKCDNKIPANIRRAIENAFRLSDLPFAVKTITLDRGSEFSDFKGIEEDLGATLYFCDPHAPWQRGLNESTNDMLRFFFPKGCNFHDISDEEIARVVSIINDRPRKCLGYLSPLEFLSKKCCT